jgi:hypothetical protein
MPNPSIIMIRLLFQDKQSLDISVSNQVIEAIELHRGVHEGYPLAPYLFIIVAKTLNDIVKNVVRVGQIEGT